MPQRRQLRERPSPAAGSGVLIAWPAGAPRGPKSTEQELPPGGQTTGQQTAKAGRPVSPCPRVADTPEGEPQDSTWSVSTPGLGFPGLSAAGDRHETEPSHQPLGR